MESIICFSIIITFAVLFFGIAILTEVCYLRKDFNKFINDNYVCISNSFLSKWYNHSITYKSDEEVLHINGKTYIAKEVIK